MYFLYANIILKELYTVKHVNYNNFIIISFEYHPVTILGVKNTKCQNFFKCITILTLSLLRIQWYYVITMIRLLFFIKQGARAYLMLSDTAAHRYLLRQRARDALPVFQE